MCNDVVELARQARSLVGDRCALSRRLLTGKRARAGGSDGARVSPRPRHRRSAPRRTRRRRRRRGGPAESRRPDPRPRSIARSMRRPSRRRRTAITPESPSVGVVKSSCSAAAAKTTNTVASGHLRRSASGKVMASAVGMRTALLPSIGPVATKPPGHQISTSASRASPAQGRDRRDAMAARTNGLSPEQRSAERPSPHQRAG